MIHYVICDLDGTLSNSKHREHLAQSKQWEAFHEASKDDPVNEDVAYLISSLANFSTASIIILTGRNEKYRTQTVDWLNKNRLLPIIEDLIMRPNDDWRPDAELKPALLKEYFDSQEMGVTRIMFFLEDRDKMVECWRNLGYNCYQVRTGAY